MTVGLFSAAWLKYSRLSQFRRAIRHTCAAFPCFLIPFLQLWAVYAAPHLPSSAVERTARALRENYKQIYVDDTRAKCYDRECISSMNSYRQRARIDIHTFFGGDQKGRTRKRIYLIVIDGAERISPRGFSTRVKRFISCGNILFPVIKKPLSSH